MAEGGHWLRDSASPEAGAQIGSNVHEAACEIARAHTVRRDGSETVTTRYYAELDAALFEGEELFAWSCDPIAMNADPCASATCSGQEALPLLECTQISLQRGDGRLRVLCGQTQRSRIFDAAGEVESETLYGFRYQRVRVSEPKR